MAVTKIHSIKSTLGKAIDYICDEEKTDEKVLISSYGCSPETADIEFKYTLSKDPDSGPNLAFHLIQSFAPGETTGEEAHHIGNELAEQLLQGKYSYVMATHIDKDHIHNHLIFCATDNIDYKKYHDCKKSYYHIRELSDRLCEEHNKSVIKDFRETGKTYHEWQHYRKGDSWKAQIKKDIDECIQKALSYDDFIKLMKNKNYEINGETFGEGSAKYITFRPVGKDRFVRGRAGTMGADYTKERIRERIEENLRAKGEKKDNPAVFTDTKSTADQVFRSGSSLDRIMQNFYRIPTDLIDKSDEKIAQSVGLSRWADKENLKRAAAIFAELGRLGLQSDEALEEKLKELHEQARREKKEVVRLDKEIRDFREILTFARQFEENKKYAEAYNNAKDPDRYYRSHHDQLTLFWGAEERLQNMGVDTKKLKLKDIEEHYKQLTADRSRLAESYKAKEGEYTRLKKMDESMKKFLEEPDRFQPKRNKDYNRNL